MQDKKVQNKQNKSSFILDSYINYEQLNRKITCLPIDFEYIPVQILSKEFTKLNNPHPYRIHYLGPRYKNTIELHKKNAFSDKSPYVYNSDIFGQYLTQNLPNSQKTKNVRQNVIGQQFSQQFRQICLKEEMKFQNLQSVSQNNNQSQKCVEKYKIDTKKIAHSYILEEKLKNSQYIKPSVFYRAFEGMNPTLNLQNEILFNSCFQNGNLDCVIKINQRQFDLFLRIDSNTRGHLLWFYFSVKNQQKIGRITMNICNFSKSKTLYKEGLRPYVFSMVKSQLYGSSWQQQGENLGLEKRQFRYQLLENKSFSQNANCLTLEYEFQYPNDEVFFAYCIPYTYSQLMSDIQRLPDRYVQKKVLGKSLLGTDIPILHLREPDEQINCHKTIKQEVQSTTSNFQSDFDQPMNSLSQIRKKRVIFITGRIHPSQSNSSYVLMGFIRWLCSDSKQAIQLRKIARFIIVPMVNPDGVIIGNSRTSASGKDLNRQYIKPDPSLHPQICLIKEIAKKIHQDHEISLFLDFHGHSRKKNTFFYGPVYSISEPNYYKCRILPKLIQKISNPFRYHSCSFSLIEQKKKTARASMFQNLGIEYTYTVESSIGYFYDSQQLKLFQFSLQQWVRMGESIAKGTAQFVTGINSYEQFLKQKRKQRLRKKKFFRSPQTKLDYLQDNAFLENQQQQDALKINYQQKNKDRRSKSPQKIRISNPFMDILDQIRASSSRKSPEKKSTQTQKNLPGRYIDTKDLDADEDSDSHDQNQDMDLIRLKEFSHIVRHQLRSLNSLEQELKSNEIKLHYDNQLLRKERSKKSKVHKKKPINQFDLLNQDSDKQKRELRNVKTGDGIRNKLTKLDDIYFGQESNFDKKKTLPEDLNKDTKRQGILSHKFQTTINKLQEKRQTHTSLKKDKKNSNNSDKRQKTIANYFGQYRLVIEQNGNNQNERKRQKYDIIRKLQSRKENSRQKRAQSSNQIKANFLQTGNMLNQHSTFCRKKKIISPPEIIHGPTEFTFAIPYSETAQTSSKSHILKPKLKLHIKPKPHSMQHFQASFNIKQRDSSANLKQKSEKMIQGIYRSQKEPQKDKKVSQSYLIQHGNVPFFNRLSQASEKTSNKEINRNSKIDINEVRNTVLINTLKVYQI